MRNTGAWMNLSHHLNGIDIRHFLRHSPASIAVRENQWDDLGQLEFATAVREHLSEIESARNDAAFDEKLTDEPSVPSDARVELLPDGSTRGFIFKDGVETKTDPPIWLDKFHLVHYE